MANSFNPFSVFRKYNKTALAVLTLLSMFAFVCVSPSMRGSSEGARAIPVMAKWKFGDILQPEVDNRLSWRKTINRFFAQIHEMAILESKIDPQSGPMVFQPDTRDGVLDAMVLEKKAGELGMTVSDQAINDFIDESTGGPLKQEQKMEALQKAIGERAGSGAQFDQFFDAMRLELLANNFRHLLATDATDYSTPEERWDYFTRLNRQATAQVLAVAVKDFVDKIPDPPEAELKEFFEKHKDQFSRSDMPEPGFKMPPRGKFQYFKAVRATFAKAEEPKITDAAIADYYDKNKESFRKSDSDEQSATPSSGEKSKTPEKPKSETPKKDDASKGAAKPAAADKSKPADATKAAPQPKADDKTKPAASKPAEPKPSGNTSSSGKSSDARPIVHPLGDDELLALADPVPPSGTDKAPAAGGQASSGAAPPPAKPAESKPAAASPAAAKPAESKPAAAKPAESKTAAAKPAEPKSAPAASPAKTEPAPIVEYRPLTDPKVRDEIRSTLANQKAASAINLAFGKLRTVVQDYRQAVSNWKAEGSQGSAPEPPDFQDSAKNSGVLFEQTPMLSPVEAGEKTELAKAFSFDMAQRKVVQFGSEAFTPNLPAYRTLEMDASDAKSVYLWWRSEFEPAYVPTFEEANVKSTVLQAWKIVEARKLALIEARKYAEEANKRLSTLKEIFRSRANMVVKDFGPFHWLSVGNVPMDSSRQIPIGITPPKGLESVGAEFMKAVFNTDVGRTAVAMNQPQTIAYVVQVQSFDPSEEAFRKQFQAQEIQAATNPNSDLTRGVAQFYGRDVLQAKIRAIEADLGYERVAPPSGQQTSDSSAQPEPTDDDPDSG